MENGHDRVAQREIETGRISPPRLLVVRNAIVQGVFTLMAGQKLVGPVSSTFINGIKSTFVNGNTGPHSRPEILDDWFSTRVGVPPL
jgi:hypothetical protein